MLEAGDYVENYFKYTPQPLYNYVDLKQDPNGISRAFYKLGAERPLIYFGDKTDPTEHVVLSQNSSTQFHSMMVSESLQQKPPHEKQTFLVPKIYLVDRHKFQVHIVMLAQLRPTAKSKGNLFDNIDYLVPNVPVKHLDVQLNSDFQETLLLMYYGQEDQG